MAIFPMAKTVFRNLLSRPATRLYPTRVKEPFRTARTRGSIAIAIEDCIFCGLCQRRCPTDAIVVTKARKEWTIDRLRCCTCNACVEVCPVSCLTMLTTYTPPTVTRDKDVFVQPPKPEASRPEAPGVEPPARG
jgi:formate hydrogenlyase subunit 6/NADH:ubiquinone oxidoreductase subunit I